jgi:hypothetical protein
VALGELLTHMRPDHDQLSARISAFKGINVNLLGLEDGSRYQDMLAHLQSELATYDDLLARVNRAKNGPVAIARRISVLEDDIADNQRRLASGNGVNNAVNAVTGLFGAHVNVTSGPQIRATIAREQAELDQLHEQQNNPQGDSAAAQQDLDNFLARVPW